MTAVSQAIGGALGEEQGITPQDDEVSRLATSLIHIANGNCPFDQIAPIGF